MPTQVLITRNRRVRRRRRWIIVRWRRWTPDEPRGMTEFHILTQAEAPRRLIVIRTAPLEPGKLTCTLEDSGPGIAPEHLGRLFESFFTSKATGIGVGLSLCRSIIERHGGELRAENGSCFGGARFSFTLLVVRAPRTTN